MKRLLGLHIRDGTMQSRTEHDVQSTIVMQPQDLAQDTDMAASCRFSSSFAVG